MNAGIFLPVIFFNFSATFVLIGLFDVVLCVFVFEFDVNIAMRVMYGCWFLQFVYFFASDSLGRFISPQVIRNVNIDVLVRIEHTHYYYLSI